MLTYEKYFTFLSVLLPKVPPAPWNKFDKNPPPFLDASSLGVHGALAFPFTITRVNPLLILLLLFAHPDDEVDAAEECAAVGEWLKIKIFFKIIF